jgi:hypothetical protein
VVSIGELVAVVRAATRRVTAVADRWAAETFKDSPHLATAQARPLFPHGG